MPMFFLIWTKVECSCQNNDNNRKVKFSMTIASWDISDGMFQTLDAENKKGMHLAMATEKRTLTVKLKHFLEIVINVLFMSILCPFSLSNLKETIRHHFFFSPNLKSS